MTKKPPALPPEPPYEKALDLMWSSIREHAYTAAKIIVVQAVDGSLVADDGCRGCAIAGSRGMFPVAGVQAPILVVVAFGPHTVERLERALKDELDR